MGPIESNTWRLSNIFSNDDFDTPLPNHVSHHAKTTSVQAVGRAHGREGNAWDSSTENGRVQSLVPSPLKALPAPPPFHIMRLESRLRMLLT